VLDSWPISWAVEFGGERIPLINPQRGIFSRGRWDVMERQIPVHGPPWFVLALAAKSQD